MADPADIAEERIRRKLADVEGIENHSWCEGYVSALADYEVIGEDTFERLVEWIAKNTKQ